MNDKEKARDYLAQSSRPHSSTQGPRKKEIGKVWGLAFPGPATKRRCQAGAVQLLARALCRWEEKERSRNKIILSVQH